MRNIITIVTLFFLVTMYLSFNYFYDNNQISEIIRVGDIHHANEKDLSKKLNALIGKEIYDLDLRLLKREIEKDLWIKYAQVSVEKPETLIVKVIEYNPIYLWNNEVYVDEQGSKINMHGYHLQNILKLNSNIGEHVEMHKIYLKTKEILSNINLNVHEIDRDLNTLKIITQKYNFFVNFNMFERKLTEFISIYDQFLSQPEQVKKVKHPKLVSLKMSNDKAKASPWLPGSLALFCSGSGIFLCWVDCLLATNAEQGRSLLQNVNVISPSGWPPSG